MHILLLLTLNVVRGGVSAEKQGHPLDRVLVYPPGATNVRKIAKVRSWANDIVPALLDPKEGTPTYRVILHNGEKPGSASGHFDATRRID